NGHGGRAKAKGVRTSEIKPEPTKLSRDELILSGMGQVKAIAIKLHERIWQCGVQLDDLISAGTLGLIYAVDHYDGRVSLNSYARYRIRGAMQDYLRGIDPLSRD